MVEQLNSLDQKWYPKFAELGAFEVYEFFDDNADRRKELREEFFAHKENPKLAYPKIDLAVIGSRETQLMDLKQAILSDERDEMVRDVYRWKINEKIAELRLARAAGTGDMRRFKKYSEFIYGSPSPELFGYTVNALRAKAERLSGSDNQSAAEAATALLGVLPEKMTTAEPVSLPGEAAVSRVRQASLELLGDVVDIGDMTTLLNSEQIVESFSHALQAAQIEGWTVVRDPDRAKINVSQESRSVKVPLDRQVSTQKMAKLVVHEIRTHAQRRNNGEHSRLLLLGLGLDRYEGGEEGVATTREQGLDRRVVEYRGWEGMLAIGLAYGLDGTPRDFRDVFAVMEKYFTLDQYDPYDPDGEKKNPAEKAWDRCVRTFRGTPCDQPGVCFTKDIMYEKGNVGVWNVIGRNPDEMLRFQVGKYDPANDRHIEVLETLGISERDLLE